MGEVIGELLAPAAVIAIGPIQIIAVILLLFSQRATANSLAFLGGWLVGLSGVAVVAVVIERPIVDAANGNAGLLGAVLQLIIGLALCALAVRQWSGRPKPDEPAKLPAWMVSIDTIRPSKALGIGLLLSVPNLKIVLLTLAAMVAVAEAHLSGAPAIVAVAIYVIVASSSVIAPVLCNLLLGERAAEPLMALRTWLEGNYATIMVVVLLVIGVVVGSKGLGTLLG